MPPHEPEPIHFEFKYLKGIVPKLLFYGTGVAVSKDCLNILNGLCDSAVSSSDPAEALDECVQEKVLSVLERVFPKEPAVSGLRKAADEINCRSCAGSGRPICGCGNQDSDSKVMADPGKCIAPLHTLFEVSSRFATLAYKHYCKDIPPYTICFGSQHSREQSLHDIPVDFQVGGAANLAPSHSEVRLILNHKLLTPKAYRAILYILFHECICHGFQGTLDKHRKKRVHTGACDKFAEGWMDWITIGLLKEFLEGELDPWPETLENSPATVLDLKSKITDANRIRITAEWFHAQRRNSEDIPRSEYADVHDIGARTAEYVWEFLDHLGASKPMETLREISLAWNLLPTTKDDREQLIRALRSLDNVVFARGKAPQNLDYAFKSYLNDHRDPDTLYLDILNAK